MKMFNDKKIIALIVLLGVFSISYFIFMNKVSYAFVNDYDAESEYQNTMEIIKASAIAYGKQNIDSFKKEDGNTIYPKVQDLIDAGLLVPNSEGLIVNPKKSGESLNSKMVTVKFENNEFSVEIDN